MPAPSLDVIFMGTPAFALPSLQAIQESRHSVIAVVTAPDKPRGRGQRVSVTPVKEFAVRHGIPLLQPADLKDPAFSRALEALSPDVMMVVAFRILPPSVFEIPKLGSVNLHASMLPAYRGAAPINWALINGEKQTGVTTFFIKKKVDTGDIILQEPVDIGPEETAGELHDRLAETGSRIVGETLELISTDSVVPGVQDESRASPAPKLKPEDCRIVWSKSAEAIKNFVRGLAPYPGAYTECGGVRYKIHRVTTGKGNDGKTAGRVVERNPKELSVAAGADGRVFILEIQPPGRKRMQVGEFLRGYRLDSNAEFS